MMLLWLSFVIACFQCANPSEVKRFSTSFRSPFQSRTQSIRDASANYTLRLLPNPNGAVCLDGSNPGYYFFNGSDSRKWYIHHMGGGWCGSLQQCYDRSFTGLGSTNGYPRSINLGRGYFSDQSSDNPMMYTWNKIFLVYCDGASFAGNNDTVTVVNGRPLYFRGFKILQALQQDLAKKYGDNFLYATDVVISGCSAGGLATFLHLDWWSAYFPRTTRVVGLQDSGFFLDYNGNPDGTGYGTTMRWVYEQQSCASGVNQDCLKTQEKRRQMSALGHDVGPRPLDDASCMFAEHTAPHIKTELFHMQSRFDAWQVLCVLGQGSNDAINAFGSLLEQRLTASSLKNPRNSAFLDSCYHHCTCWDLINIDHFNVSYAFDEFYYNATARGPFVQSGDYPCNTCCIGTDCQIGRAHV